jgi:hypothetical protein
MWLYVDPERTLPAWKTALECRAVHSPENLYRKMLADAREFPEIKKQLHRLTEKRPELWLVYLSTANQVDFEIALETFLVADPYLNTLSEDQLRELFKVWAKNGNQEALETFLEQHSDLRKIGWRQLADLYARGEKFQAACDLAAQHAEKPVVPAIVRQKPLTDLKRNILLNPQDFASAYALYLNLIESGHTSEGLETLQRCTDLNPCPAYFHYLEAKLLYDQNDFAACWAAWVRYLGKR